MLGATMVRRGFGVLATALLLTGATPSLAASHFTSFNYGQDWNARVYTDATLGSKNDIDWKLILDGCTFTLNTDTSSYSEQEKAFRKLKASRASLDMAKGVVATRDAKAIASGRSGNATGDLTACEPTREYWVTIIRVPNSPGVLWISVLGIEINSDSPELDVSDVEVVESHAIALRPDAFALTQEQAADIGGMTAGIYKALAN